MSSAAASLARPGLLHCRRDVILIGLAGVQGAVLVMAPWTAVVALGLWWNSNTVAHYFLHRPFFRPRWLNVLFALYLSVLLGVPQSIWRERHLAHHADRKPRLTCSPQVIAEVLLIVLLWGLLLACRPVFFLGAYLPGYAIGLGLCWLHGHYEHVYGTVSHHGWLYNFLFFNDGYHVEHHAAPGLHWARLPERTQPETPASRWPAVLRWLDDLSLDGLERCVLHCAALQRFVLACHERAFRRLLPPLPPAPRVAIVGGGLFPRTLLVLQRLLPDARFRVIDRSAANLATAQHFLSSEIHCVCSTYEPSLVQDCEMVVFPLAYVGNREAIYRQPPAPAVLVHDWLWRSRGISTIVSALLLKRLNRVPS
jgi:fatty acid desaturase